MASVYEPACAAKVGVTVKVACVDVTDMVKILLIVESSYVDGVVDLTKCQVRAPHF